MEMVNMVLDWIIANLGTFTVAAAVVLEMLMRIFPTQVPWSMLLVAKALLVKISAALVAVIDFLNKVLPQNVK